MTLVVFENPGVLDIRALTVMGLHAKPGNDNAYGEFGTGLKYAMAVLARHKAYVRIQTGNGDEYIIQSGVTSFRDRDFNELRLVHVGTTKPIVLPYTTIYGKNWKLWQVLRELECNARDEGGSIKFADNYSELEPEDNTVRIIVDCDEFYRTVQEERPSMFFNSDDSTLVTNSEHYTGPVVVAAKPSNYLYAQGLRVYDLSYASVFTYNMTTRVSLTEDRTLMYYFNYANDVAQWLMKGASYEQIIKVLSEEGSYEWNSVSDYIALNRCNDEVRRAIDELFRKGKNLPTNIMRQCYEAAIQDEMKSTYRASKSQKETLTRAIDVAKSMGYGVDDYEIAIVKRVTNGTLGTALRDTNKILITELAFEMGFECVVGTLIEEWLHLARNMDDCSRQMQDWLLRQLVLKGMEALQTDDKDT